MKMVCLQFFRGLYNMSYTRPICSAEMAGLAGLIEVEPGAGVPGGPKAG